MIRVLQWIADRFPLVTRGRYERDVQAALMLRGNRHVTGIKRCLIVSYVGFGEDYETMKDWVRDVARIPPAVRKNVKFKSPALGRFVEEDEGEG